MKKNEFWGSSKPVTWPLQDIILARNRQGHDEETSGGVTMGFVGERPEGVPQDVDEMIQHQRYVELLGHVALPISTRSN